MVMTALLFSELYASSCAKCFLCIFSCNTHNKAGNSIPLVCPFFFTPEEHEIWAGELIGPCPGSWLSV